MQRRIDLRVGAIVFAFWLLPGWIHGQAAPAASGSTRSAASLQQAVDDALLGEWTGLLTYRDFSQPADSTKRVQLPTWLSIRRQPEGLRLYYVYDDGPGKVVRSESTLDLNTAAATYRIVATDYVAESYSIKGLDGLRDGRGVLTLDGGGKENDKPVDVRETLTLRRNLISWLRESRPSGSSEKFAYRHEYTFVRSVAPAGSGSK